MDTVYTQKIFSIDVLPSDGELQNVAIRVRWEYRVRQGTAAVWTVHTTDLDTVTDTNNFVSFDELTEELVLGWVNAKEDLTSLKLTLDSMLESELTKPEQERIPPWENVFDTVLTREYVIVHNDEVIWGPMRWNTASINQMFQDKGINLTVPNVIAMIPENDRAELDANTFIYRFAGYDYPDFDSFYQDISQTEIVWDFSTGQAKGQKAVYDKTIDELKASLLYFIENQFQTSSDFVLEYQGKKIIIQQHEISEFTLYSNMLSDTETVKWKDHNTEQMISLNKTDIGNILDLTVQKAQEYKQTYITYKESIEKATTVDELKQFAQQLLNMVQ